MTMIPEYRYGGWFVVETSEGGEVIPDDVILGKGEKPEDVLAMFFNPKTARGTQERFEEFLQGKPEGEPEWHHGWGCRLSMPGYMDCTDWVLGENQEEVRDYIVDTFECDPDTGKALDEDGKVVQLPPA